MSAISYIGGLGSRSAPARRSGARPARISLATMLGVLVATFLIVPVLLFAQFRVEQKAEEALVLSAVRDQTRLIGAVLETDIRTEGLNSFGELDERLKTLVSPDMRIKVLYRPDEAGLESAFLYVASSERIGEAHLAAERSALAEMDILSALEADCRVETHDTFRFASDTGGTELVLGVMPVRTARGCWAVISSYKAGSLLDTAIAQPLWRKPQIQFAFAGYLVMAAVVGFIAFRIKRSVDRLRSTARAITSGSARHPSFAQAGAFPEMDDAVRTFDRMVEELRKARLEAEMANQSKSRYLANISHELRTPLNAIIGFSEMIEGQMIGPIGEPRYLSYASDIRTSGSYLLSLINDVLDLAKLEAGRYDLTESWVDTRDLAAWAIHLLRSQAHGQGHSVTMEIAEGLPRVFVDERAFRSILVNLISNAIKYTPEKGRITVSAGLDAAGALCLSVADTGAGISEADQAKVLEPYGRVDDDLTVSREGTGLGLPIVKHLVELHDGSFHFTSTPGEGTTVTVRVPADRLERTASHAA